MPPGRGAAGAWGRLKPVELDALEAMGLPSKGETRLLDPRTQNQYYTEIVKRYLTFCSDAGDRDSLLAQFASMSIGTGKKPSSQHSDTAPTAATKQVGPRLPPPDGAAVAAGGPKSKDLVVVMMALRKLREAIVATKRADDFAVQVYLFNIRLAILVKTPESYHPAIQHLLRRIHPVAQPLTSVELQEVVGYLVLDAACRRGDLSEAHVARLQYGLRDPKVDAVLDALAHDNYAAFARLRGQVDGHKAKLMEFAAPTMRRHALSCLGRSYLSVDVGFLEKSAGRAWAELQREDGVGWERDDAHGDGVINLQMAKSTPPGSLQTDIRNHRANADKLDWKTAAGRLSRLYGNDTDLVVLGVKV
ncbi:hypothetical protein OOU_Y34scaffold00451g18 [Pyricularia oryzae Y34]|uniref:CSN8/PSMD8/EIF3K domain-containing protein n=2 Tax=Pyricularia oryzae TaxID=318829 RepID=A0AA97PMQ4_PYRO3|nr:hypothetical protein OOU_Y34scaffold00451g18 [Pyricularia oryzae Y34]